MFSVKIGIVSDVGSCPISDRLCHISKSLIPVKDLVPGRSQDISDRRCLVRTWHYGWPGPRVGAARLEGGGGRGRGAGRGINGQH